MRPGKTIHTYLDGERERLTNPIRFLLMTCAIVTATFLFGLPKDAYLTTAGPVARNGGWDSVPPEIMEKVNQTRLLLSEIRDEAKQKFLQKDAVQALEALDRTLMSQMAEISLAWMNVFLLFGLPINAMISWLFFRRARLNFTEHIVANGFILGIQNLGAVFTVPIVHSGMMDLGTVMLFYMLLSFLFQFMAWKQVFAIQGLVRYFIGLFAIVLSVIGYVFVQGIAITVIDSLAA